MAKDNRTHKDSVFTDLFYSDRDAKKNLLQLYNALYDEQEDSENLIQLIRLDGTLFMDYKNDAAFTIGNRRIILFNINLPFQRIYHCAAFFISPGNWNLISRQRSDIRGDGFRFHIQIFSFSIMVQMMPLPNRC